MKRIAMLAIVSTFVLASFTACKKRRPAPAPAPAVVAPAETAPAVAPAPAPRHRPANTK